MRYKGDFVIIARDGWPLEQIKGHPILNFFRRLLLGSHKQCRACLPINVYKEPLIDIAALRALRKNCGY